MNPYTILEVAVEATFQEIKIAYRQMSMVHHPDRGGDSTKFVTINLAYKILSDPEKRKLYDETGVILEESPDHIKELVRVRLINITEQWLALLVDRGEEVSFETFAIDGIEASIRKITNSIVGLEKKVKKYKKIQERLKCEDASNVVFNVINGHITRCQETVNQNSIEVILLKKVRTEARKFKYEVKKKKKKENRGSFLEDYHPSPDEFFRMFKL